MNPRTGRIWKLIGAAWVAGVGMGAQTPGGLTTADYPTIQEAVDRNPGRMIYVPAGDHVVSVAISIRTDHAGLWGPGRIISTNPDADIIALEGASGVQVRDLTLTRAEDRRETTKAAVAVSRCRDTVLSNLTILNNSTSEAAVAVGGCDGVQIRDCLIKNYCRISIDDRRRRPSHTDFVNYGYAFTCISGNGLMVKGSTGVAILGNRIIETRLLPTPEIKEKYRLGTFVAKDAEKGRLVPQKTWDEEYVNNWNQSRALGVTSPTVSDYVQIIGNYVENAGQGMDIHADHVILAANIVNNSHIGMKAMHGARNVLVIANQFSKSDLWSINLMPGTSSHPATAASASRPAQAANIDGYSIVADNIISDFGFGNAHWIWAGSSPLASIRLDAAPLPENPPLQGVVVEGNVIHDVGRDGVMVDGQPRVGRPHYAFGIRIGKGEGAPHGLVFGRNLVDAGTEGVSDGP